MPVKPQFTALALAATLTAGCATVGSEPDDNAASHIQHIRNATIKVSYDDTTFLIDPMLSEKGTYPGFEGTYRSHLRNPLVDLPMPAEQVIEGVDAVIVTHTHLDHWDDAAQDLLPKDIPLFVQNGVDAEQIRSQGFANVTVLEDGTEFGGVTLDKTGGQHGSDALYAMPPVAEVLGSVMGVVFEAPGHKTIYLAGDTVWRDEVDQTLARYHPEVIVLNTGAAALEGMENDPILMGKEDTKRAYEAAPKATIVTVHMDAVNHMTLDRAELSEYLREEGIQDRVLIPADGEVMTF